MRNTYRCAAAVFVIASIAWSVALAPVATAKPKVLLAYPAGTSTANACPKSSDGAKQCNLAHALSLVKPGGTVALAVSGDETDNSTFYIGNFSINTPGTSAKKPVTIAPGKGVTNPIVSGNNGTGPGCAACDGSIFSIGAGLHVKMRKIIVQDGHDVGNGVGGAIENGANVFLTIIRSTFVNDHANAQGGAIGSTIGTPTTITVIESAFAGNSSGQDGGAISNGRGSIGTLTVTRSTFTNNGTVNDGGAIDAADVGGGGTLSVSDSTFTNNSATHGGAITNGRGVNSSGAASVTRSTFVNNHATNGGAIDNGASSGNGALTVHHSTFVLNSAANGGAINNAGSAGSGTLTVTASTFANNTATVAGGAINNSPSGTVQLAGNVFASANCASGTAIVDGGYNVSDGATCFNGGTANVTSPRATDIGALNSNGGPTATIALLPSNPGVRLIPNNTSVTLGSSTVKLCPTVDQRGVKSKKRKPCNTGAVHLVKP